MNDVPHKLNNSKMAHLSVWSGSSLAGKLTKSSSEIFPSFSSTCGAKAWPHLSYDKHICTIWVYPNIRLVLFILLILVGRGRGLLSCNITAKALHPELFNDKPSEPSQQSRMTLWKINSWFQALPGSRPLLPFCRKNPLSYFSICASPYLSRGYLLPVEHRQRHNNGLIGIMAVHVELMKKNYNTKAEVLAPELK